MRRSEQRRHDARNLGVIGVSAFAGLIATAAIVLFNASPAAWLALRGAPPIAIAFAAADPEPMPASVRCHDPLAGLAGLAEAVPGSRVLVTPSGERHALADPALSAASRLFGTVHTRDGATHRGFLRWDRNEGAWADLLHAKKFDHGFSAVAPTWRWGRPGVSGMRFGHIASIVPMSRSHAIVHLRSGQEVGVEALGTDLGRAMRSLTVTPPLVAGADAGVQGPGAGGGAARGQAPQPQVVLEWEDLKRVDFEAAPAGAEAPAAEDRLYGTLTTTGGAAFTGLITWDMDEIFAGDVLDGDGLCAPAPGVFEEEGRRRRGGRRDDKVRRAVPFAAIQTIWQRGSSAAEVELLTGERITLSGTNDVNARNRGITVSDPGIGLVTVPWSRFARVDFKSGADVHGARGGDAEAVGAVDSDLGGAGTASDSDLGARIEAPFDRAAFDGGARLHGTVITASGERLVGDLRWDLDEYRSWDLLNGQAGGVEFEIEFARIERISRTANGATVALRDGRALTLTGSNDVGPGNRGVAVLDAAGAERIVAWRDFAEVVLHR